MTPDSPRPLREELEAKLTALLLGELSADDAELLRKFIAQDPALAGLHERLKLTIDLVRETARDPIEQPGAAPEPLKLSEGRRQKLLAQFKTIRPKEFAPKKKRRRFEITLIELAVVVTIVGIMAAMLLPTMSSSKMRATSTMVLSDLHQIDIAKQIWAEDNKKSANDTPTFEDLRPYLRPGSSGAAAPAPPRTIGGTYVPGKVGEHAALEVDAEQARKISLFHRALSESKSAGIQTDGEQRLRYQTDGRVEFAPATPRQGVAWSSRTRGEGSVMTTPVASAPEAAPASQNYSVTAGGTESVVTFGAQPKTPQIAIALPPEINGDASGALNAGEQYRSMLANNGSIASGSQSLDEFANGTTRNYSDVNSGGVPHMWGDGKPSPGGSRESAGANQQQSQLAANNTYAATVDPATGLPLVTFDSSASKGAVFVGPTAFFNNSSPATPDRGVAKEAEGTAGRGGRRGRSDGSTPAWGFDDPGQKIETPALAHGTVVAGVPVGATPEATKEQQLETRTFRVDPNNFRQGLESAGVLDLSQSGGNRFGGSTGGNGGGGAGGFGGGGGGGGGGGALYYRLTPQINVTAGTANTTGGSVVTYQTNAISADDAATKFYSTLGVQFQPNSGKSIFYDDKTGELTVRANAADMDRIEAANHALSIAPPQITTKAKFAEVAQDDRKALGFDWYLGNQLQAQGGTPPTSATERSPGGPVNSPAYAFYGEGKVTTQLPLPDGPIDLSKVVIRDKVATLGDLPFSGRLFRSESKQDGDNLQRTASAPDQQVNLDAFFTDLNKQSAANRDSSGRSDSQITSGLRGRGENINGVNVAGQNVYGVNVAGYVNITNSGSVPPSGSGFSDASSLLDYKAITTLSGRTTTVNDADIKTAVVPLAHASAENILSALQDTTGANPQRHSIAPDQLVRRNRTSSIALPNGTTEAATVSVDNSGNLVVIADHATIDQIRESVQKLDQPTKQVLIESKVLETSMDPGTIRGINWAGALSNQSPQEGRRQSAQVAVHEKLAEAEQAERSKNLTEAALLYKRALSLAEASGTEANSALQESNSRITTIDEALGEYAALTGRQLIRPDHVPAGNANIALTKSQSLTKEERKRELDVKLALNGIAMVDIGDKFVKVVPQAQAGQEGAAADANPPKPATPPPIPQPEVQTSENPFSTFSLNVSDVSFKLAAASLEKGAMPEAASIRSEEFINAFDYRDPEPTTGAPLAFAWDRARYPFAYNRDLLRFSIKTAAAGRQAGRPLNLVLVLDNSGSMERADRVQIIHEALRVLATQLQAQDTFSVVLFSRTARLWVDGKAGSEAGKVAEELSGLTPEGGTNLEEAMNLAYATALRHYLPNGINRVVLLTDGAANLGDVEPDTLKQKVEAHRKQGIALDCFGIGWEGYNDDLLEVLSRNGDGRYGFLNSPEEAATEFAAQLAGALKVAASDVKVQVEFNPKRTVSYRQIGYAKHQLTKEQFRDNTVDAAEIAAQEAGNALYAVEVNPAGEGPIATVRVRYKVPGTTTYREQAWDVPFTGNALSLEQASQAMRLAATASAFSEWLASNPYAAEVTPDRLLGYLSGVPEVCGADTRPKKLEWMIRQAKSISGK